MFTVDHLDSYVLERANTVLLQAMFNEKIEKI